MKRVFLSLTLLCSLSFFAEAQVFNLVGSAWQQSCTCYGLTPDAGGLGGSIWNINQINLNTAFDYNFRVFLGTHDSPGADGICFVIQNTSTNVGGSGGGLGYQGFPNQSIGIELDTYQNGWDPAVDHIALNSNGSIAHDLVAAIPADAGSANIEDGVYHDFRVTWVPGTNTLTAYFNNVLRFSYVFPTGLVAGIFGGNPNVFWGFTGATGGESNLQQVCLDVVPSFSVGSNYVVCGPTSIQFTSTSQSSLNNITAYAWNFGDGSGTSTLANPTYTYATSGTYNVSLTITDQSGCQVTQTNAVTVLPPLSIVASQTNVTCFGLNNGTATVTASGGTGVYTTSWTPAVTLSPNGPTTFTGVNLSPGPYSVTVSSGSACLALTNNFTITEPTAALAVVSSHTNVTCPGAANGTITVTISGGTAPYSYNGTPLPGNTITVPSLPPAIYSGTVTDANGCTATASETITEPGPQSLTLAVTNNTCNGGTAGSITATFVNGTGAISYVWNPNVSSTNVAANLPAGAYAVTATDANNCVVNNSATVTEPAAVVMTVTTTPASCFGGTDGSATANASGGTGAYTYNWSTQGAGPQTLSNFALGNYTVTATDAVGCVQVGSFSITEPTAIAASENHTNVLCYGYSTGDATLNVNGGTGAYTYVWSPNVSATNTATGIGAANYDITVTDANNCSALFAILITQPAAPLSVSDVHSDVLCTGGSNGSITLTVSGGTGAYTYTWSPNVSSNNTASNLAAGVYDITVADANACDTIYSVTIQEPAAALSIVSLSFQNPTCYQSNDGQAQLTMTGGTGTYVYVWSPNVSTADNASNLAAGTYNITITDANSCTADTSFTLTEPAQVTLSEAHTNSLCNGDMSGTVIVTAGGGTGNFTYTWNPSVSTTDSALTVTAGTYSITATDGSGCSATVSATVTEPPVLAVNTVVTNVTCFGAGDGTITATCTGGTAPYTFAYTPDGVNFNNSSTGNFAGVFPGTFTVLAVDSHSCTVTTLVTITEPPQITLSLTTDSANCFNNADGSITVLATGGTPSFSYTFSTGETNTTGVASGLAAGSYNITATDANGCTADTFAVIEQPDSVIVTIAPSPAEIDLGEEIELEGTANYNSNITYSWFPITGLSCYDCANPTFSGVLSQDYVLTVLYNGQCEGSAAVSVVVIPDYSVFLPNAFSPNASTGANDDWQIFGNKKAIKQLDIQVFNRTGEKVFETNDIDFHWNGDYRGAHLPPAVYVYSANIVWLDNHSDDKYHGTLTIVR